MQKKRLTLFRKNENREEKLVVARVITERYNV